MTLTLTLGVPDPKQQHFAASKHVHNILHLVQDPVLRHANVPVFVAAMAADNKAHTHGGSDGHTLRQVFLPPFGKHFSVTKTFRAKKE